MKDLKQIEEILTQNKSVLRDKFKVVHIGIFGSYVHGEQSKVSDIDILGSIEKIENYIGGFLI